MADPWERRGWSRGNRRIGRGRGQRKLGAVSHGFERAPFHGAAERENKRDERDGVVE